ncbi:MAG: hypothetical protein P1Q69_16850 [Candidatus Thorarchaeota archaeon]|nr:hypothetical protein [Candidatus Thorarchaeota archaeon]
MKTKQRIVVLAALVILTLPMFADAATYYGNTNNTVPTIFTTLTATGGSNRGDIDCYGYANLGWYNAYALVYTKVTVATSTQIKIGITWNLSGKLAKGFQCCASWRAYYFWAEYSDLWSFEGGHPEHSYIVDEDTNTGWYEQTLSTSAYFYYTSRYTIPDNVPANTEICIGIMFKFSLSCPIWGYARISGSTTSNPMDINVNYISYQIA